MGIGPLTIQYGKTITAAALLLLFGQNGRGLQWEMGCPAPQVFWGSLAGTAKPTISKWGRLNFPPSQQGTAGPAGCKPSCTEGQLL